MPSNAKPITLEAAALPVGRAPDPDSFAQQITRLEVGETASRSQRLDAMTTTFPMILEVKAKMRNVIGGQVSKVKAKKECAGRQYTTAIGHFHAENSDTLVVVTVTRIK